jgi:hypothetical protein
MIAVNEHRALLNRMLEHYGLSPECLEVVPDVQKWCENNGVEERNPWRAAKCFYGPDGCHIVMCEELHDHMISSAKSAMELNGFERDLVALDSDEKYLVHLMLHEIACFTLQTSEQEARDRWAFQELSNHAA